MRDGGCWDELDETAIGLRALEPAMSVACSRSTHCKVGAIPSLATYPSSSSGPAVGLATDEGSTVPAPAAARPHQFDLAAQTSPGPSTLRLRTLAGSQMRAGASKRT